ncbi:DUF2061 domain-containing protein [Sphingobacterium faecium]|uniref:DUF2061 domain-containing protein n=1 Tax=Sphingobacterium faecium TaxID=34087 RepID=UPI003209CB97
MAIKKKAKSHLVSLGKAISWRIFGSIITAIAFGGFTQDWKLAFFIASIELISKIFLFYIHDRVWEYFTRNKESETDES